MVTGDDLERIDAFIDLMVRTLPPSQHLAVLSNLVDSAPLTGPRTIVEFLAACGAALVARGGVAAPSAILHSVAGGMASFGDGRHFLRAGTQAPESPGPDSGDLAVVVVRAEVLHSHLLADDLPQHHLPVALPPVPNRSKAWQNDYRRKLQRLSRRAGWYRPSAALGKPFPEPINCWLSTDAVDPDPTAPSYGDDRATEARDRLGLVYGAKVEPHLVRISFAFETLKAVPGLEMRRPTITDQGNERFAVVQTAPVCTSYYSTGWGMTIHLGKLRQPQDGHVYGVPEAVTSPLPLSALAGLTLEYLGQAQCFEADSLDDEHDRSGTTPGSRYAAYLSRGRTVDQLTEALRTLCFELVRQATP